MSDRSFEDVLRTSLSNAADSAPRPPALPRRRVRARQAALAGAAGVVVVLGAFGALGAAGDVFTREQSGPPPAGPGGEPLDPRGAGGEYPCELSPAGPGQSAGSCIATGERNGLRWTLGASLEPNGNLCMILETVGGPAAGGAGASCNAYEPGTIGLEQMGIEGLALLAYGQVPAGAETLYVEHGDDRFELEVYPAPRGLPMDDGFYLVWLPDDATRLVAYDAAGDVVATRTLDESRPDESSDDGTGYVPVAEGSHEDVAWKLEVFGVEEDGRDLACVRVLVGPNLTRSHVPCDASFGRSSTIGIGAFSAPELRGVVALGGVTGEATKSVAVVLEDREVEAEMFDAPPGIEPGLRFFVAFLPKEPEGLRGTIVVRNRSGDVLERRDVCVPGGDRLSC